MALYKKPSTNCGSGTVGYRNIGSLINTPYNNSKKLLYGLLALNVPVTEILINR